MSTFRTSFALPAAQQKISVGDTILSVGSCFADTIGSKLAAYKFPILTNPFGVLFHPLAITQALTQVMEARLPSKAHYVQSQGLWRHLDLHSDFSNPDLVALERQIQNTWSSVPEHLANTKWLFITLGTATVYRYLETGETIANCQKVPASAFEKKSLSLEEITDSLHHLFAQLWERSPDLQVILTVSPVRHIKDGMASNSYSKALLRVAVENLAATHPTQVTYFPSYELLMDDLRDYRFYGEDMIHPNETAKSYIWQRFIETHLDEHAQQFVKSWHSIAMAINHRPRFPESPEHQAFLHSTLKKLRVWEDTVDTSLEEQSLRKQLL